jgi:hypothetical protein
LSGHPPLGATVQPALPAGIGFARFIWEDESCAQTWAGLLEAAQTGEWRQVLANCAVEKQTPSVLALPPFEVPLLLRASSSAGLHVQFLGMELPVAWRCLFPNGALTGLAWCALLPTSSALEFTEAWEKQDYSTAAAILGVPGCCIEKAAAFGPGALRIDLMHRAECRWLALGVGPHTYLPCTPDCGEAGLLPPAELHALPSRLSVSGGICELLTPAFQLVFDCCASLELEVRHNLPEGGQPGWSEGRGLGNLPRTPLEQVTSLPNNAMSIPDMAAGWPALKLWSRQWLDARLGQTPVGSYIVPLHDETVSFCEFTSKLFDAGDDIYLFSLPFSTQAADMRGDYVVPRVFASLLSKLPEPYSSRYLGELFLGGAGTATFLHQDILHVGFWMTVIWGRKRWALCSPDSDRTELSAETNLFDPTERTRLQKKGIEVFLVEQNAGDTIYVPPGWWHQVENKRCTLSLTEMVVDAESGAALDARVSVVEEQISEESASVFRLAAQLALKEKSVQQRHPALQSI